MKGECFQEYKMKFNLDTPSCVGGWMNLKISFIKSSGAWFNFQYCKNKYMIIEPEKHFVKYLWSDEKHSMMDYIASEYLEKLLRWMRPQIMQFCYCMKLKILTKKNNFLLTMLLCTDKECFHYVGVFTHGHALMHSCTKKENRISWRRYSIVIRLKA